MSRMSIVALVAALVISPAAVQAQSTITACYVPKSGSVYRIKTEGAPSACKSNHVEFSWETGAQGWGMYETHSENFTIQPGEEKMEGVLCPPGTAAMSGGFVVLGSGDKVRITSSHYQPIGNSWYVSAANDGPEPATVKVEAYCAVFPQ